MTATPDHDAIIVGGGPAGATCAALLAEHGHRVLVLEKAPFPRYHVGESLMPHCYFPLQRLGLVERMRASHFPRKYSVQFVRTDGHVSSPFYFRMHRDHPSSDTWQVVRGEFDALLLDTARERGAEIREGVVAKELLTEDGAVVGVRALDGSGASHTLRARVIVDATGRDGLAMGQFGWRVRDDHLHKVAIWTYFRGARRDPGLDEGATTVGYLPHKGWFWYIPLPDDVVSVGVVAERDYLYRDSHDPAVIFRREATVNAWIDQHLDGGAQFGPHYATGEFTYRSRYSAADGLVLVGDAFAFLDPIFSSGVLLALKSGELAADAVHEALAAGDVRAARFADYSATLRRGIENIRRLVHGFYDENFSFREVIERYPSTRGEITDCLIGDLFRDYEALFTAISEFAQLPPPLPHGNPRIREP